MKCPYKKCNHPKDFTATELKEHIRKSHMKKIFNKKSEQDYTKTMLAAEKDNRVKIISIDGKNYPHCIKHGAMVAYEKAYRCIECGFSVLRPIFEGEKGVQKWVRIYRLTPEAEKLLDKMERGEVKPK